jgi:protein-tyrosine phosphatase
VSHVDKANPFRRQDREPARAHVAGRVDIHCHCLPGLDDGPATMSEALGLCRNLVADGIMTAVATPHQLGRYDGCNGNAEIRAAVSQLNRAIADTGLPLRVWPGADVRIDERIPDLLARDEVMTVADRGRHLLVELPAAARINPLGLARDLRPIGITPIITHPERCEHLCRGPQGVFEWLEEGICLQLTAGSIVGGFGPLAEAACWYWLRSGAVSLIATDAHGGKGRRPLMSRAFAAISRRLNPTVAHAVCIDGPQRVFRGQQITPAFTAGHVEVNAWR